MKPAHVINRLKTGFPRHLRYTVRQLVRSKRQAFVFVLCVILSVFLVTAIGGFKENVNQAILNDARILSGGDIMLRSYFPFSTSFVEYLDRLKMEFSFEESRIFEFYSVARSSSTKRNLLCAIKVVDNRYPLHGKVQLQSGQSLQKKLSSGKIITEQALLDRLYLKIGDRIEIGNISFTVSDVLLREPDRPVNLFSFGPRILVSTQDLEAMDLIKPGSRVRYRIRLKTTGEYSMELLAKKIEMAAQKERIRVNTFKNAPSRIKRFFDNLLFYLYLCSMFTFFLAGIGIQSTLGALLKEQTQTIGIMKAVGSTNRFIVTHYLSLILFLGMIGTFLGVFIGIIAEDLLYKLFHAFLPVDNARKVSMDAVINGIVIGMGGVLFFTLIPLSRIRDLRPIGMLQMESPAAGGKSGRYWFFLWGLLFLVLLGFLIGRMGFRTSGIWFILATAGMIAITVLVVRLFLKFVRNPSNRYPPFRNAVRGLARPGNSTHSITITLTASLTFMLCIYFVEHNLSTSFEQSFPEDAPNLFLIDIQADQVGELSQILPQGFDYHPIVRARIDALNDNPIDFLQEQKRKGDNLARTFNLTYRDALLSSETLSEGKTLFRNDWQDPQVSVLDEVLEIRGMAIGDSITFSVQGVPITARISSIRSRSEKSLNPFFYFVLQESVLKLAPKTFFTAIRLPRNEIPVLLNRISAKYANIIGVDITETISTFSSLIRKLCRILRFLSGFGVLAGILIIASAALATRMARIREAVYYKILGAKKRFILHTFMIEHLIIGSISGLTALGFSHMFSFIMIRQVIGVSYQIAWVGSALCLVGVVIMMLIIGFVSSLPVLKQKPAPFLRQHAME